MIEVIHIVWLVPIVIIGAVTLLAAAGFHLNGSRKE